MKKLINLINAVLLLVLPACVSGQGLKFSGYPNVATLSSDDLFLISQHSGAGTKNIRWDQMLWLLTNQMHTHFEFEIDGLNLVSKLATYDSHVANLNNPHNVTYTQVGAEPTIPKTTTNDFFSGAGTMINTTNVSKWWWSWEVLQNQIWPGTNFHTGQNTFVGSGIISTQLISSKIFGGPLTPDEFSIIVVPDPQVATVYTNNANYLGMVNWIHTNYSALNCKAVICTGDEVEDTRPARLAHAKVLWDQVLADGMVSMPIIGNHDYDGIEYLDWIAAMQGRFTTNFNAVFGPSYFSGKSWYGSTSYPEGQNDNYYTRFNTGSYPMVILALEFFPTTNAMTWAKSVIEANQDAHIIILSHAILNPDGTLCDHDDQYGPDLYSIPDAHDGPAMFEQLVYPYSNVVMTINGHFLANTGTNAYFTSPLTGHRTTALYANHQTAPPDEQGFIVVLKFKPAHKKVEMYHVDTWNNVIDPNHEPVQLDYYGQYPLYLNPDGGNVSIGISANNYKLDVGGDVNIAAGSHYKIGGIDHDHGTGTVGYITLWNDTNKIANSAFFQGAYGLGYGTTSTDYSGTKNIINRSTSAGRPATMQVVGYAGDTSLTLYSGLNASDYPSLIWQAGAALRFGTATNYNGAGGYTELVRIDSDGKIYLKKYGPGGFLQVSSAGEIITNQYPYSQLSSIPTNIALGNGNAGYLVLWNNESNVVNSAFYQGGYGLAYGTTDTDYSGAKNIRNKSNSEGRPATMQVVSYAGDTSLTLYSGLNASDYPSLIWQTNAPLRFGTATNYDGAGGYTELVRIGADGKISLLLNAVDIPANSNYLSGGLTWVPPWSQNSTQANLAIQANHATNADTATTATNVINTPSHSLDVHSNILFSSPFNNGQVVKYSDGNWVNGILETGDLSDYPTNVITGSGTDGQLARFDSDYVVGSVDASTLSVSHASTAETANNASYATTAGGMAASGLTSGTLPDDTTITFRGSTVLNASNGKIAAGSAHLVIPVSPPGSPETGSMYYYSGKLYIYNGSGWDSFTKD